MLGWYAPVFNSFMGLKFLIYIVQPKVYKAYISYCVVKSDSLCWIANCAGNLYVVCLNLRTIIFILCTISQERLFCERKKLRGLSWKDKPHAMPSPSSHWQRASRRAGPPSQSQPAFITPYLHRQAKFLNHLYVHLKCWHKTKFLCQVLALVV